MTLSERIKAFLKSVEGLDVLRDAEAANCTRLWDQLRKHRIETCCTCSHKVAEAFRDLKEWSARN